MYHLTIQNSDGTHGVHTFITLEQVISLVRGAEASGGKFTITIMTAY